MINGVLRQPVQIMQVNVTFEADITCKTKCSVFNSFLDKVMQSLPLLDPANCNEINNPLDLKAPAPFLANKSASKTVL